MKDMEDIKVRCCCGVDLYHGIIAHLEILNKLPPTNGINSEIEFVREEALKILVLERENAHKSECK